LPAYTLPAAPTLPSPASGGGLESAQPATIPSPASGGGLGWGQAASEGQILLLAAVGRS